jgi:hypothetical protein
VTSAITQNIIFETSTLLTPTSQLHLTKPRPPCWDSFLLAWRSDTLLSLLMSDSLRSRWGHKSNWCRLYFPFRISKGQRMVYCPFSTANITPRIFLESQRPLSTDGMGTATLSPTVPSFIITRLRLTTRSACFCCAAIASFLFLSMLLVGWGVSGRGWVVSDRGWVVSGRGWVVESFLVEVECLVELSCWTEWLVSHLPSVASG